MSREVLLVHGAWLNALSWEHWVSRLQARGHRVSAPSWPHLEGEPARLRASPPAELSSLGVEEIVAHYAAVARTLDRPILVGHSFGGLFVQKLLDLGLGAAGVAIDPAPAKGILPSLDALAAALPVVSKWNAGKKAHSMSFADWQWGWMHTQPEAEQRAAFERYVVPAPGRVYVQGAAAPFTDTMAVNFGNRERAPLLLVAGLADRTVSASMVKAAYARHAKGGGTAEILEFPGRTHWICGQPGWEAVCDAAMDWAEAR